MKAIIKTKPFGGSFIVRIMVGTVFFSEGIQKFLFPVSLGSGRFEKIGIPYPSFFAPFVGTVEIMCGLLILIGFYTRIVSIPPFIIMIVAIIATKLQILTDQGFWEMLHGSRTDWAMLLGSLYLVIYGGGLWSIDNSTIKKKNGFHYRFY